MYSSLSIFMVEEGVEPGMSNSIWMLSSEESSIEQCQINIENFN